MFKVILNNGKWWISNDDKILDELGSFIDPISPKIIVEELNGELHLQSKQRGFCERG